MSVIAKVALVGLGEVGQTLAQDLGGKVELSVWDIAFADSASPPSRFLAQGLVRAGQDLDDAVHDADLVISAVTADQDLVAAINAAPSMASGAFFLDLNSCSPGQKTASAEVLGKLGLRYVEAAVMSPIGPKRIATPMLLGGPHARDFLAAAADLGFDGARFYHETIGRAAATKLCRSVMIKGVEALLTESMLAARHYGVEQEVLDSLSDLLPLPDWNATAQYMISRTLEHGKRRAEEMREAARTVEEAGVAGLMSRATAERQDWSAQFKPALSPDLRTMLDAINESLEP